MYLDALEPINVLASIHPFIHPSIHPRVKRAPLLLPLSCFFKCDHNRPPRAAIPPQTPHLMAVVKILYTDLDGTCVHYEGFDDVSFVSGCRPFCFVAPLAALGLSWRAARDRADRALTATTHARRNKPTRETKRNRPRPPGSSPCPPPPRAARAPSPAAPSTATPPAVAPARAWSSSRARARRRFCSGCRLCPRRTPTCRRTAGASSSRPRWRGSLGRP
jgi:hypothetical protein